MPPAVVEALLVDPEARIVAAQPTSSGSAGAWLLTLQASHEGRTRRFQVKWRSHSSASPSNSPRKELASYFAQALFLDPLDYVFPPTRSRCFDLIHYRKEVAADAQATFTEAPNCVYGVASLWLGRAKPFTSNYWRTELVHSQTRWRTDPVYRRTLADANLLAYLTANGDTHAGNWLKLATPRGTRVYLVDGSISFDRMGNPSLGPGLDLSDLVVPRLREESLRRLLEFGDERLRRMTTFERLIVQQERVESSRIFEEVAGPSQGASPDAIRWTRDVGSGLREMLVGLAPHELRLLRRQLWYLRARAAMGEFETLEEAEHAAP